MRFSGILISLLLISNVFTGSISLNDQPIGFASVSKPSKTVTVSTKSDFVKYVKAGGYIVYVKGSIDISEGYRPTSAGGTTTKLDNLVQSCTSSQYTSYTALRDAYAKSCSTSTNDKNSSVSSTIGKLIWNCNYAYANIIKVSIASNTWIIGSTTGCAIRGAAISISNVSNVVIRNLFIEDGYDPFPHHESNDGYNAQHDNICISGSSNNIWIDHCSFKDLQHLIYVKTGGSTSEKWQTYDGLLDMKGAISSITISWCVFQNHDKTMLIGSSDSDGSSSTRTVTLHHNYFLNCAQRLPMARNVKLHVFNNYYDTNSNGYYSSQYCIGVRAGSLINAENNYFGSGIAYSAKENYGKIYFNGNSDNSSRKTRSTSLSSNKVFTIPYSYTLDDASNVPTRVKNNVGAGKTLS